MKKIKILTHAGVFHADEIFALGLYLRVTGASKDVTVSRIADSEFGFSGAGLWGQILRSHDLATSPEMDLVVDIGGELNFSEGLMDHHQYQFGKSAAELMLDYLVEQGKIHADIAHRMRPQFQAISGWDTGETREEQMRICKEMGMKNIPMIVAGYNRKPGTSAQDAQFIEALKYAINECDNLLNDALAWDTSQKILDEAEEVGELGLVSEEYPAFWGEQAPEVRYIVSPSPYKEGQWQVLTRDSNEWPLPDNGAPGMVFIHKALFIAAFVDKESAVNYTSKLGEV